MKKQMQIALCGGMFAAALTVFAAAPTPGPGEILHRNVTPAMLVTTNAWQAVSNRVDFTPSNATLVATINAVAPAPGNYAVVSNAAMSAAAQTNDFLRLSGGTITGDLSINQRLNFIDGHIESSVPGIYVFTDIGTWLFRTSFLPETEMDVMRRGDLSDATNTVMSQLGPTIALANSTASALANNYYTKAATDEAIANNAAYYITSNPQGDSFPTLFALTNASAAYYSGGVPRTPSRNDYAVVLADESHQSEQWRYIFTVSTEGGVAHSQWSAQYRITMSDYNSLRHLPQINGVTLGGTNNTAVGLGLIGTGGGTITGPLQIGESDKSPITFDFDAGYTPYMTIRDSTGNFLVLAGNHLYYQQYDVEYGAELFFPTNSGTLALTSDIAVKSVKRNGTPLVPDAGGSVNVEVPSTNGLASAVDVTAATNSLLTSLAPTLANKRDLLDLNVYSNQVITSGDEWIATFEGGQTVNLSLIERIPEEGAAFWSTGSGDISTSTNLFREPTAWIIQIVGDEQQIPDRSEPHYDANSTNLTFNFYGAGPTVNLTYIPPAVTTNAIPTGDHLARESQFAQKADLTNLPYSLVSVLATAAELPVGVTVWIDGVQKTTDIYAYQGKWVLSMEGYAAWWLADGQFERKDSELVFRDATGGEILQTNLVFTQYPLADRAVNALASPASHVSLLFPSATSPDKSRDFYVRFDLPPGAYAPSLSFPREISLDLPGGEFPAIATNSITKAVTILHFTETISNTFAVSSVLAPGGGSGGGGVSPVFYTNDTYSVIGFTGMIVQVTWDGDTSTFTTNSISFAPKADELNTYTNSEYVLTLLRTSENSVDEWRYGEFMYYLLNNGNVQTNYQFAADIPNSDIRFSYVGESLEKATQLTLPYSHDGMFGDFALLLFREKVSEYEERTRHVKYNENLAAKYADEALRLTSPDGLTWIDGTGVVWEVSGKYAVDAYSVYGTIVYKVPVGDLPSEVERYENDTWRMTFQHDESTYSEYGGLWTLTKPADASFEKKIAYGIGWPVLVFQSEPPSYEFFTTAHPVLAYTNGTVRVHAVRRVLFSDDISSGKVTQQTKVDGVSVSTNSNGALEILGFQGVWSGFMPVTEVDDNKVKIVWKRADQIGEGIAEEIARSGTWSQYEGYIYNCYVQVGNKVYSVGIGWQSQIDISSLAYGNYGVGVKYVPGTGGSPGTYSLMFDLVSVLEQSSAYEACVYVGNLSTESGLRVWRGITSIPIIMVFE